MITYENQIVSNPERGYRWIGFDIWFSHYNEAVDLRHTSSLWLQNAIDNACIWHEGQTYGAVPYVLHCMEVVDLLLRYDIRRDIITAAWHHDVLEDCGISNDQYKSEYGTDIWRLVNACTGRGLNRKEKQANIRRSLLEYPASVPIKMCDRIINMKSSIQNNNTKMIKLYTSEVSEWVDILPFCPYSELRSQFENVCGQIQLFSGSVLKP